MAAQAAVHDSAVPEILALLSDLPIVTAVTIQGPDAHGGTQIIIRKVAQRRERRTQYRYTWEARAGANGHAWEQTSEPAYQTAALAYQAAVQSVDAALSDRWADDARAAD